MTIEEIERLLDSGRLEIHMRNGNWWAIRRNGETRRWKRDPNRFSIPFKAGLKACGRIETTNLAIHGIRECL